MRDEKRWVYPRFASNDLELGSPLALNPRGDWDPATEYWGEPGASIHPLCRMVIDAGTRPSFEMEQVVPGNDDDDWDSDPISDALDLYHDGDHSEAIRILDDLVTDDIRCLDTWVHLGLIAFETDGPGPAAELYEMGVAVGEASLPPGFSGVLPWGWLDNRPFLRCLHGFALCAWRLQRWDAAAAIFTSRVWIDPSRWPSDLACLAPVEARRRWTTG